MLGLGIEHASPIYRRWLDLFRNSRLARGSSRPLEQTLGTSA